MTIVNLPDELKWAENLVVDPTSGANNRDPLGTDIENNGDTPLGAHPSRQDHNQALYLAGKTNQYIRGNFVDRGVIDVRINAGGPGGWNTPTGYMPLSLNWQIVGNQLFWCCASRGQGLGKQVLNTTTWSLEIDPTVPSPPSSWPSSWAISGPARYCPMIVQNNNVFQLGIVSYFNSTSFNITNATGGNFTLDPGGQTSGLYPSTFVTMNENLT